MRKNTSLFYQKLTVLSLTAFSVLFFLAGSVGASNLPAGGSSFSNATPLQPGTYQGGALEVWQTPFYYSVQARAGQKISVESGTFSASGATIYLYNAAQTELKSSYATNPKFSWLVAANNSPTYYLRIDNDASAVESFTLTVSLANYYDANSQTDAGGTFDTALTITPGNHSGYLAGNEGVASESGNDTEDMYKVALQKGVTYSFKLTPPSKTELTLRLYDSNRQLINEGDSANKGASVSLSLTPAASTNVFVSVLNNLFAYQDEFVNYRLQIASSVALTKFYSCASGSCGLAGEFASAAACQTATTKTCYALNTCNGACGGGGEATPVPSTPVGQDECVVNRTQCFDNFNYNKCGDYNRDSYTEWSTPVYCGQGYKCQTGQCVAAVGCQCSAWTAKECGISGCAANELSQSRTCAPANCDTEKLCAADSACLVLPPSPPPGLGGSFPLTLAAFFGTVGKWFFGIYLLFWILFYIYLAISLQFIAKKTNTPNPWLAWLPVGNIVLMFQIAQKPLWWLLLLLVPLVNIVIGIIVWMAIAEKRGQPNWWGILLLVPVVGLIVPGYLAFFDYKSGGKPEITPPYVPSGTQEADKPTVGYKHPCKYCGKLIPPDSAACPFCEKVNPLGPFRCARCHEPIEKDWKVCAKCNLNLRIVCPFCGKTTFFGEHCEDCGKRLLVACPNCGQEQPPLGDNCIKCGRSLNPESKK